MDLETDNDSHSSPFSSTSSSSSLNLPTKSIMAEDDIVELFGDNSQAVRRSQTQKPTSEKPSPPPILRGSGSGGGEGNAPLHEQPSHHNIFIQEDEMASWFHQPHFYSDLFYSAVVSNPFAQPPSSVSLPPPPPPPPLLSAPYDLPHRPTGGRPEAGPSIPVRQSTQVVSSAIPSSSATEFSLTPATLIGGLSHTFAVPGLGRKENPVATDTVNEIAGTSSLGVSKAEKEPIQIQPATATETEIADDDKKRKEREETIYEIEESKEAPLMSRARKRSRAAEMHNISERRRREKINEKMKALQELIPRCNKSNRASILDDAIEYVKSLQMQIQMMPMGGGMSMTPMMPIGGGMSMTPMMYAADMQRFMAMGVNRPPFIPPYMPFPRQAPMAGFVPSYPAPLYRHFPNIQASQPARVHLPSQQPDPLSNQPHDQFAGLHQRQEPPSSQDRSESAGATP